MPTIFISQLSGYKPMLAVTSNSISTNSECYVYVMLTIITGDPINLSIKECLLRRVPLPK